MHLAEEMVAPRPDCMYASKNELESGSPAPTDPKMRPFSEPSGNVPILRGLKTGPNSPPIFDPAPHSFFCVLNSKKVITVSVFSFTATPSNSTAH